LGDRSDLRCCAVGRRRRDADGVSGVLRYQLVAFWPPILPGYLSYTYLRRVGRL
jgi:hypothetical protein